MATLRLTPDDGNRSFSGGRVLMGGSPLRILKLSETGAARVAEWFAGAPVDQGTSSAKLAARLIDRGLAHPTYDAAPFTPADVTVVIPVKDDPVGLESTLAALGDVGGVVVVDDGSHPPVAERQPHIEVRRNETAEGPGPARNQGLTGITTPLVAFVDADVAPNPGWLDALLPHFADPSVAAVAPRVASMPSSSPMAAYEQRHSPLDLGHQPARVAQRSRVSYVPSACLACRVDVLNTFDPCFDPALRYGEDVDLIWRLVGAGHTVRYEPRAVAQHRPRPNLTELMAQRRGYGSAAAPLSRRHPGALPPLIASWWSVLALTLGGLGFGKLAAAIAVGGTASLKPKLSSLPEPGRRAVEISAMGNLAVAGQYASSLTRTWWPVLAAVSAVSKRGRRAALLALVGPTLTEMWRTRTVTPIADLPLRILDDISYGTGVWQGCVAEQTAEPLLPDLTSWRP